LVGLALERSTSPALVAFVCSLACSYSRVCYLLLLERWIVKKERLLLEAASHTRLRTLGRPKEYMTHLLWRAHSDYSRIMSATVRENIIFFHEYEETFYNLVIEGEYRWFACWLSDTLVGCALGQDLALLPNGDLTEVGEKGKLLHSLDHRAI